MRQTLNDMLKEVTEALKASPYHRFEERPHFFPDDVVPHSRHFKYICNKLAKCGLLLKDEGYGRWGYRYRFPEVTK